MQWQKPSNLFQHPGVSAAYKARRKRRPKQDKSPGNPG